MQTQIQWLVAWSANWRHLFPMNPLLSSVLEEGRISHYQLLQKTLNISSLWHEKWLLVVLWVVRKYLCLSKDQFDSCCENLLGALNSSTAKWIGVGLTRPRPPNLIGRASNCHYASLGLGRLHDKGIKKYQMAFSKGLKRKAISSRALVKGLHLFHDPRVKHA